MTNILKDLWNDRERGICWLPQDVFRKAGFDLSELSRERSHHGFDKGLAEMIAIAHGHVRNALAYTLLLPRSETMLRKFCLWAIGMAIFTLKKINKKRNFATSEEAKISRRSVKGIIWATFLTVGSNLLLKILFFLTARGLPTRPQPEDPSNRPNLYHFAPKNFPCKIDRL
jgi:farnesyl-diphosphate farnesyltransferase